jgi:uncharacterized LabA/DUF88 family protein
MIGLYVDISDLYFKLLRTLGSGKLNYAGLLAGNEAVKVAYGCQNDNEAAAFIRYLKSLGFVTKYKKPYTLTIGEREIKRCSWGVGIATDVLSDLHSGKVDSVIICSSNPDLIPLLKHLKSEKINVMLEGCGIPNSMRKLVSFAKEYTVEDLEPKNEND